MRVLGPDVIKLVLLFPALPPGLLPALPPALPPALKACLVDVDGLPMLVLLPQPAQHPTDLDAGDHMRLQHVVFGEVVHGMQLVRLLEQMTTVEGDNRRSPS